MQTIQWDVFPLWRCGMTSDTMWGLELALKCVSRWTCKWQGCKDDLGRPPVPRPEPTLVPSGARSVVNLSALTGSGEAGPRRHCYLQISLKKERKGEGQWGEHSGRVQKCTQRPQPVSEIQHFLAWDLWLTPIGVITGQGVGTIPLCGEMKGKKRLGQKEGIKLGQTDDGKRRSLWQDLGDFSGSPNLWTAVVSAVGTPPPFHGSAVLLYLTPSPLTRHFHT